MRDRVPLYPGRVKLVPVSGQENVYDMTRADQPTQQGDPLNKATLLKDATAALFGLGADAVPDDVLAYVGKYAQHWWKKYKATFKEKLVPESDIVVLYEDYYSGSVTLKYSNSVYFDSSGKPALSSPSSLLLNNSNIFKSETQNLFKGKYVSGALNREDDVFLLSSSENPFNGSSSGNGGFINRSAVNLVTGEISTSDDFDYVQSPSKSAYPENGVKDGYYYQYIGIPFENAATAPKIATGSYVGTGKYDEDNPNSLTFEFEPKLVFIGSAFNNDPTANKEYFINVIGAGFQCGGSNRNTKITKSGKSISWYNTNSAHQQLNYLNAIYYYTAIG